MLRDSELKQIYQPLVKMMVVLFIAKCRSNPATYTFTLTGQALCISIIDPDLKYVLHTIKRMFMTLSLNTLNYLYEIGPPRTYNPTIF